ncbi:MAG: hypothetical protein ABII02_00495 [Candidatus Magasanikbacteria bacterium]
MKKIAFFSIFVLPFFLISTLSAAMTGGQFIVVEDGFSFVESITSTGGTFELHDYGNYDSGSESGGDFEIFGGFLFPGLASLSLTVSAGSLDLGTLSTSATSSDSLTLTVTTDSSTGYTVSITEDGNLRSGANDIDDVSDTLVSVGAEEYGIHTTIGTSGLLDDDTAIDGTVNVMANSGAVTGQTTDVTFTAGITGSTVAGSYSNTVTFTATVNP